MSYIKKNRIMSVVLVITMIFGCMLVETASAEENVTVVQTYSFDGLSATPSSITGGELKGDPVYPGQTLYGVSSTNTLSSEIKNGVISYDFYIPNEFYSTDSKVNQAETIMEIPNVIKIFADQHGILYYGSDSSKKGLSTYGFGKWFTITLLIDADNSKVSVYMNGVCLVSDSAFSGDTSSVKTVSTALTKGIYIDNVYVAATDNYAIAKSMLDTRFSSNYRYVETMDREGKPNVSNEAKFAEELIRGGTSPYGEYRRLILCQVTDSNGKQSQIWVPDDKMSSTITTYGEANVTEIERKTVLRIKTGSAVKKLKAPISSGIIKVGIDAFVDSKCAISLLNLKDNGSTVLDVKLLEENNGETGIYKTTLNDDLRGGHILDKWTNFSVVVDLNANTAELFVDGVSGGVKSVSDFNIDTIEIAGINNLIYIDSLTLEGFKNVDEARTSIAIETLNDDITFSKVADFVQKSRDLASTDTQISKSLATAKNILSQNDYQRDKFGEIQPLWEENFNYADNEKITYSGSTVVTKNGRAVVTKTSAIEFTRFRKELTGLDNGIFTTEFDFMTEKRANIERLAMITDLRGNLVCYLRAKDGNILLNGLESKKLVENYKEGQWYTFSIKMNFDTKKYDIFVNGERQFSNVLFTDTTISDVRVVLDTFKYADSNFPSCEYLIDNVKVYRDSDVPPIAVSSPKFSDTEGNLIWKPVKGGGLDSVFIRNENGISGNLYAAVYDGEQLKAVKIIENVQEGINNLNLDIPSDAENIEVKFFTLKDKTLVPLDELTPYKKDKTTLFVLSDSIYDGTGTYQGIGDKLSNYFSSSNVTVHNAARSGHTLTNIASLGYLDGVLDKIEKGDYVIISFAHNDSKASSGELFAPVEIDMQAPYKHGTYQSLLIRYAQAIRLRGGNPIFITSLARHRADSAKIGVDHGNYIEAMKNLAEEIDVPLIDLNKYSVQLLKEDNDAAKTRYVYGVTSGSTDSTHLTSDGADFFAKWIAGQMKTMGLAIGEYVTVE